MSGFFGMVRRDGKPIETRFLEEIAEQMSFRGPDGRSVWVCGNVGGCFTLMVTGPAKQAAEQPVSWGNRFWLWGDLRLDGRGELQEQLGGGPDAQNADLTSEELLLWAWAKWGAACLERVIGDFSFALWDGQEQTLWCARDFMGPRPFYYSHTSGLFCFSNTLNILRRMPELSRELDEIFLGDFLVEGWQFDPWRTVYRDIRRLPGGHVLKFSNDEVEVRRFRRLPIDEPLRLKRPEEYLDAYRSLLRDVVAERLPGKATSLYLSGGLDSTTVCAVASQIADVRAQKQQLKAFTVSCKPFFDDPEPELAQVAARHIGIEHELILPDAQLGLFQGAGTKGAAAPEPNDDAFFASEQRTYQTVAAHGNVVLSGDGGDQILTGQWWPYLKYLWSNREWRRIFREFGGYLWSQRRIPPPGGGFRTRFRALLNKEDPYEGFPEWLNENFEKRAALRQRWSNFRSRSGKPEHPVHPLAYESLHRPYWPTVLETEDTGWNRVRLESRAPLFDLRMLTFLLRLPPVPWCMHKYLCRQAMQGLLPREILTRPKTPLLMDPFGDRVANVEWIGGLAKRVPGEIEEFVNWKKWCETLYQSKGFLTFPSLRPASLFYWLKAVESD